MLAFPKKGVKFCVVAKYAHFAPVEKFLRAPMEGGRGISPPKPKNLTPPMCCSGCELSEKSKGVKIRDPPLPSLPLPLLCPSTPLDGSDVQSARGVGAYSRGVQPPGNSHTVAVFQFSA
jgi:hypothetical protein